MKQLLLVMGCFRLESSIDVWILTPKFAKKFFHVSRSLRALRSVQENTSVTDSAVTIASVRLRNILLTYCNYLIEDAERSLQK